MKSTKEILTERNNLFNINDTVFYYLDRSLYLNTSLDANIYKKAVIKEIKINITCKEVDIIYVLGQLGFTLISEIEMNSWTIEMNSWKVAKTKEQLIKQLKQLNLIKEEI